MSVNGESFAFEDSVEANHDVDPAGVDWVSIFNQYTGSDGLLDLSTRADVIRREVDGIHNSRQAEALLAAAADGGYIDERDGDYYLERSGGGLSVDDIDWRELFADVAEGVSNPLPSAGKRKFLIKSHLGLDSEEVVDELISDAFDRGIIVNTDGGLYLTDALENGQSATDSDADVTADDGPDTDGGNETRPELEALREDSDDVEEYVGNLEGLLTDVLDRLEAVEKRQDRQDERADTFLKENQEQRVGLSELQIRRLREGDMLSTDGVDMDVLRDEFGDDLVEVSGGNAVRLAEPKIDEDSSRSTDLPNFEEYCELEAERLKLHLKLRTPEDIKRDGIYKYRCLTIWSNAEMLATSNDEFAGKMAITKPQVESWILKHARNGAKESSMDTVCNRVMDEMSGRTDGVIEKKIRNGNSVLVFEVDEIEDARCPRFQSRSIGGGDGGDLITPLL